MAERGARRQQAQVPLGAQLTQGEMVVPGRHQVGRRDVVVVDDEGLGPAGEPGRHGRRGGELVHDDVAPLGDHGVVEHGNGLPLRVRVDRVDVDLGAEATGTGGVTQAQGVPPDRVATVQDRDEVVDAAHEGVAATSANRPSGTPPSGRGPTSTKPARSSSSSQVEAWRGRPSSRSRATASASPRRRPARRRRRGARRAPGHAGSAPAAGAARGGEGDRPPRSGRGRRASPRRVPPGTRTPRRW